MHRFRVLATALLVAGLTAGGQARAAEPALTVDAGDGQTLVVERAPLRIVLRGADGRETVATVPATATPPVRTPGIDGPQPIEPLGAAGGFPALGWVAGARAGVTWPLPAFTGNRLFGAEAGALVSATSVERVTRTAGGATLALATTVPGAQAQLTVTRLRHGGVRLHATPPPTVPVVSSLFTLASPEDEALYGLGARKDAFDQRGRLRNVWTEEQNATDERAEPVTSADPTGTTGEDYTFPNGPQAAYFVTSMLHGSRGWTGWVEQTDLSRLDLAASRPDAVRWGVAAPELTLKLAGGGIERSAQAAGADVGRAPAPPRYAYEPWIDVINEGEGEAAPNGSGFSGGPRVKAELEQIVAAVRRHRLPVGVLGVEGWHQVPDGERFFAALRRQGFRLSAYWNPFTTPGTPAYEEAVREGVLVRDVAGRPYELVNNRGGRASVIDFSHPNTPAYWRRQLERSASLGFDAFMQDFGEYVTDGMRFHDGTPPETEHNRYPVRYHRTTRDAVDAMARERPGFQPFFYVRSGFTGAQAATPSVFPGDETTDWSEGSGLPSVVPAMLNLALDGAYAFTTDVGGYFDLTTPRTTPELMTRWAQLAAFTPISRIHDSTFNQSVYPWELGAATLDAYRRYARAKVRLIPLVDRWARRAAADGTIGPVRPLVLEDPAARSIDDQWLLGTDLLVAPVLEERARSRRVYLPRGALWERVTVAADGALAPTGEVRPGGATVTAPAPLADIPVYRRLEPSRPPGGRRCLSRRRFAIHVRVPRNAGRVRRAAVSVAGRTTRARRPRARRGRVRLTVDLRTLPRGRVVVRARVVTSRRGTIRDTRLYRTCTARR